MTRIALITTTLALGFVAAAPAFADPPWRGGKHWRGPPPPAYGYYAPPPRVYYAPPPPVYYAPPPVYYAPPPAYVAPGLSFGLNIPLR